MMSHLNKVKRKLFHVDASRDNDKLSDKNSSMSQDELSSLDDNPISYDEPEITPTKDESLNIPKNKWRNKKMHACLFCQKLIKNITRHLQVLHANEDRIKDALVAKRTGGVQGNIAFQLLRREGDALYNKKVHVKEKILVRDSSKSGKVQQVACPYCNGFFSKKSINRHVKQSCKAEKESNYRNITGVARVKASLVSAEHCRPELINDIFPFLTKESQRSVLLNDPTAISFGNTLIEKHFLTNLGGKHVHIAQQLRLLADLFNTCKSEAPEIQQIKDMFHPRYFENIMNAVKKRSGYFRGKFDAPSTATSSCTLISKVLEHLKTRAIMSSDVKYEEALTKLEYLLNHNRNNIITKIAGENRTQLQRAKVEALPTTAEVKELMKILETEFNEAYNAARNTFDVHSYSRLCKAILAYIMAFNRKRPGDCQKALVLEFRNAATVNDDCLANIKDADEKNRASSFFRFVSQGKLNKKASNLLTRHLKEAIDFLLERRSEIGIDSQNRFLFANPKAKRINFFRADEALRDICNSYNLKYENLTANKLRKHLATSTSMLSSKKQALISDFMGHSVGVHKNIYQQRLVRTEVITMSQLLLESAGLSKVQELTVSHPQEDNLMNDVDTCSASTSKIIDSIKNSEMIDPVCRRKRNTLDSPSHSDSPTTPLKSTKHTKTVERFNTNVSAKAARQLVIPITPLKIRLARYEERQNRIVSHSDYTELSEPMQGRINSDSDYKEDSDDSEIVTSPRKVARRKRTYDKCLNPNKKSWSTPERHTVRKLFGSYISNKTVPSLSTIADVLSNEFDVLRPPHIVRAWIVSAINKSKLVEAGRKIQGWSTPQKQALKTFFKPYLDKAKRVHEYTYPPTYKIRNFLDKNPHLHNKSCAAVKSKLQHEYRKICGLQK